MASFPIALLRDDFTDNNALPVWTASTTTGSGSIQEISGQQRMTLPSSIAGTHSAQFISSADYDLTGDSFYWNIQTMVSTSVAATAVMELRLDADNILAWSQLSGTLFAQKVVAGVLTNLYSVAWNASTHKYLRIRESGGNILFDTSTNGTSWTNRHTTAGLPIAITALQVFHGASCGNVASPGSLRLDDVNLILPVPSSTWRETTADWSIENRMKPVTLASDGGKQGVLVTADTMDETTRALGGTVRYFGGPLGSASGGYLALTEYASLALAQASPFTIPINGRVDLPELVDARYMRLYHRSIDASAHTIYEYVPRRIVQADDIEAESIQAINIAAGAITADKIFVLELAAIAADMGTLHMTGFIDIDLAGGIFQGTGTVASPTNALKLFNSGGIGKLSSYNAGVEQVTIDTDGALKAGAGNVLLDDGGITIEGVDSVTGRIKWSAAAAGGVFASIVAAADATIGNMFIRCNAGSVSDPNDSRIALNVSNYLGSTRATVTLRGTEQALWVDAGLYVGVATPPAMSTGFATIAGGLNIGSATGAAVGQISTSGSLGVGVAAVTSTRIYAKGSGTTGATATIYTENSAATNEFYVNDAGVGFLNNTAWTYSSDATRKRNIRPLNKDIVDFMKLDGKLFDYIDGQADRYGYIAQDVLAIIPSVIETLPDGSLGMRTDEINIIAHAVLRRLIRILVQKNIIGPADIA